MIGSLIGLIFTYWTCTELDNAVKDGLYNCYLAGGSQLRNFIPILTGWESYEFM